MERFKFMIPVAILGLVGACDEAMTDDAPDRAELVDAAPTFRPGGGSTGGGSILLNTGLLFGEDEMPLRHFSRAGAPAPYDDPDHTTLQFKGVTLRDGTELKPNSVNLTVKAGALEVDGAVVDPEDLVASKWFFSIASDTIAAREFEMILSGVAYTTVASGLTVPLYNFSVDASVAHYGSDTADFPVCDSLDLTTVSSTVVQAPDVLSDGTPNVFNLHYSAVLYGGVNVSQTGVVSENLDSIYLGCASGSVGKAALWGYPAHIPAYNGLSSLDQLQGASRAIMADYCADGTAHTQNGTVLQIRDRFRGAFADPTEATEAVWGDDGSSCVVIDERVSVPGMSPPYDCGGALTVSCKQRGSDWIVGSPDFMWTKVSPTTTTYEEQNACDASSLTPGCSDPGIEAIVCAEDSYCCTNRWDEVCVGEVAEFGAEGDACCSANGTPDCGDVGVTSCVGDVDPYCTGTNWDSYCALEVEHLGCGLCR